MKKEYLLNKVTDEINTFLAPFDLTATMASDWGYYDEDNSITWSPFERGTDSEEFVEFAATEFCFEHRIPAFLLSILHEVGHAETADDFEQEDWDLYLEDMKRFQNEDPSQEKNYKYFNLPIEYAATEWAVNYANENWDRCNKFINIVTELFNKFYEANIEI